MVKNNVKVGNSMECLTLKMVFESKQLFLFHRRHRVKQVENPFAMKGFTSWFLFYCAVHFSEPKSLKTNRATNTGKFWHLSDLHLDFYYDYTVSNKTKVCPSSYEAETIAAGPWGDYR